MKWLILVLIAAATVVAMVVAPMDALLTVGIAATGVALLAMVGGVWAPAIPRLWKRLFSGVSGRVKGALLLLALLVVIASVASCDFPSSSRIVINCDPPSLNHPPASPGGSYKEKSHGTSKSFF